MAVYRLRGTCSSFVRIRCPLLVESSCAEEAKSYISEWSSRTWGDELWWLVKHQASQQLLKVGPKSSWHCRCGTRSSTSFQALNQTGLGKGWIPHWQSGSMVVNHYNGSPPPNWPELPVLALHHHLCENTSAADVLLVVWFFVFFFSNANICNLTRGSLTAFQWTPKSVTSAVIDLNTGYQHEPHATF